MLPAAYTCLILLGGLVRPRNMMKTCYVCLNDGVARIFQPAKEWPMPRMHKRGSNWCLTPQRDNQKQLVAEILHDRNHSWPCVDTCHIYNVWHARPSGVTQQVRRVTSTMTSMTVFQYLIASCLSLIVLFYSHRVTFLTIWWDQITIYLRKSVWVSNPISLAIGCHRTMAGLRNGWAMSSIMPTNTTKIWNMSSENSKSSLKVM